MKSTPASLFPRLALFATLAATGGLTAQTAAPLPDTPPAAADAPKDEIVQLDNFVVTAVSRPGKSRLESSISVSSLPMEKLDIFTPRNTAELFRSLPGIRVESTSGEGNANLTVRGLPLADGGSRYVQIQEDGLPIVEFGDIAFGNADVFFRSDATIGNVESVRGGSAAIFASNSPGGVINMISKDGKSAGGTLALTYGVDFDSARTEFNYGSPINETLRFNVGGFLRTGEGPRTTGTNDTGGQLKFNVTKDFAGGYVRLYVKAIDDTAPTYLPAPARIKSTSSYGDLPGFDVLTGSLYTANLTTDDSVDSRGNTITRKFNGIHTKVTSVGAEIMISPAEGLTITNRFRVSSQSAHWGAPFPASVQTAAETVANFAGKGFADATQLVYGSGPNKGGAVAGSALVTTVHSFSTDANDMGWMGNDLKLNKFIRLGNGSKLDLTAGYYRSQQKIVQDWTWGTYLIETKGDGANTLNLANAAGTALTSNGHLAYAPIDWNFSQTKDLHYTVEAPVASITVQTGKISVDVGVRRDSLKASGSSFNGTQKVYDLNKDGVISGAERGGIPTFDWANGNNVNYDLSYTSYSAGLNFAASKNLAYFGRYSFGGRAGADRLAGNAGASGPGFQAKSFYYDVTQTEVGVKYRADQVAGGQLVFNGTVFHAKTREPSGAELNKVNPPIDYNSTGLELEAVYRRGNFELRGNATYTDAEGEITSGASRVTFAPQRQAKFIYTIAPSFSFKAVSFGGSAIGTTKSYFKDAAHGTAQDRSALVMPAYVTINAFVQYQIAKDLTLSLNANNLLNAQGWTEGEDGSLTGNGITRARTITGLTTSATLRYSF